MQVSSIDPTCFKNAVLFRNRQELSEACKILLNNKSPIISEVGVYQGYYSTILNKIMTPSKFYLIDTFNVDDTWTQQFKKENHLDYIKEKFSQYNNIEIIQSLSWYGLKQIEDNKLDYCYIDASHAYEDVKQDIEITYNKIKSGGIIQFNDYTNYSICENLKYGVFDAVNEFIIKYKPRIIGLSLANQGYHDLAVQITK
jgi:hypothetical protein